MEFIKEELLVEELKGVQGLIYKFNQKLEVAKTTSCPAYSIEECKEALEVFKTRKGEIIEEIKELNDFTDDYGDMRYIYDILDTVPNNY